MQFDPQNLRPTDLVRLLNATPLGQVIDASTLHRQRNASGLRFASHKNPHRVNLLRYIAWLIRSLPSSDSSDGGADDAGSDRHDDHAHRAGPSSSGFQRAFGRKSPMAYEDRLRRDLESKLERSRVGRDIGTPPAPTPEGIARRFACACVLHPCDTEPGDTGGVRENERGMQDPQDEQDVHGLRGFRGFCETYFPASFNLAWSEDHLRIIEKIERAITDGGLFAFAMPRGTGKSLLCRTAALWALLYGYCDYVCLIGSAEDQARTMLDSIKRELLSNDLLLADFPEVVYPIRMLENNARKQAGQLCNGKPTYITWSGDKLVLPTITEDQMPSNLAEALRQWRGGTHVDAPMDDQAADNAASNHGSIGAIDRPWHASGVSDSRNLEISATSGANSGGGGGGNSGGGGGSGGVVTVAGLDSNIRGQHHTRMDGRVVRPSLVILDDPQTRQSAASRTQTKHRLDILNGDVLGMAGPTVKMAGFMTCTKIHHDDLADQVLDRQRNPEWQGECTRLVNRFPTNEKLWDQYAQLRAEGLREGDGGRRATHFYVTNREAMDEGAEVPWPDRYLSDEVSALQHAMNLKLRDEEAFFAEYQNDPVSARHDEAMLTPDQVAERVNGRSRRQVPKAATSITASIDVQETLLYYVVCAWESDFTGYIIDYGTCPDQGRRYFTRRDAPRKLADVFGVDRIGSVDGRGITSGGGGVLQAGIEKLVAELLERRWSVHGGGTLGIEKLLIDAGYMPEIIENACQKLPGSAQTVVMPSKGVGIKAGNKPISSYRRKQGERYGHHWYVPNVSRTRELRHVLIDTNYWKTFIHQRLGMLPGDRGAMTLFGKQAAEHRLLADHIAASETFTRTEGHGRLVQEWTIRPGKPDNHWFDCMVGSAVAASMSGVADASTPVPRVTKRKPKKSLNEMYRERYG